MTRTPTALAATLLLLAPGCGWLFDGPDDMGEVPVDEPPDDELPFEERPQEEPFTEDCIPDEWRVDDGVLPGAPLTLSLMGTQVRIEDSEAPFVERVEGPGSIEVIGPNVALVAFGDATVDATHHGTLVVVGEWVTLGEGTFDVQANAEVDLHDLAIGVQVAADDDDDGLRPVLSADAPAGHQAALDATFRYEAPASVVLTEYELAYVVLDDGTRVELAGPVQVQAPHYFAGYGTTLHGATADATWLAPIVVGLAPTRGEASGPGGPLPALPSVSLLYGPSLRVGPGVVETIEPARAKVALDDLGAVLPSGVELRRCAPETLVMWPGETRILTLAYRQTDPSTDAVFADFTVELDGTSAEVEARIETASSIPAQLQTASENHPNTTWGQGFIDFVEAWTELTAAFGKAAVCVFTFGFFCPDDDDGGAEPPSLRPYPAWMAWDDVGEFELEITAPAEPGEHGLIVRITGDNYDAEVPLRVLVAE